jgi:hypothetical protein
MHGYFFAYSKELLGILKMPEHIILYSKIGLCAI